jgi:flagellar hook-associated protein 2
VSGAKAPPLESDGSLREAQQLLLSSVAYSITGNNGVVNLSSIGVKLNNDGTLSVNSSQLQTALASNSSAVQNFLQNTTSGFGQNLSTVLTNINSPGSGILGLDATGITNTSQSLAQQLNDLQIAFNTKQAHLIVVYSQVNATLQELPLLQYQTQQQLAGAGL